MDRDLPSLTVAVSTRGARALDLDPAWPEAPGLDYLVLVQDADADPRLAPALAALEARPDIEVHRLASTGLSRSRNAALDLARGEVLLVADDDVTHLPGAYVGIRAFFAENPGVSLLAGQSFDPEGRPRKRFAPRPRRLRRWNAGGISSHELAVRLAPVRAKGLRFDEVFGAGAGTAAFLGEEYIFVADCLQAGLRGAYLPLPVTVHPAESSGFIWVGAAQARARAAVIARVFGPAAGPMRLAFALKNRRRFGSRRDLWAFLRG
jgi:glycosyltransferase involved in cell wall biosynthesis